MTLQEAIDIVRNNQFANGPRYEQAWQTLEAAVSATASQERQRCPACGALLVCKNGCDELGG